MTYENLESNSTKNSTPSTPPWMMKTKTRPSCWPSRNGSSNDIIAAEAADLPSLSAKELIAHFQQARSRAHLPKGMSKAKLIDRINELPPLEPTPAPKPTLAAEPETFSVAAYAKAHGLDGREIRKKLRATGKRAPYTVDDVEAVK